MPWLSSSLSAKSIENLISGHQDSLNVTGFKERGTRQRGQGYLPRYGAKDCLWIERRQMWSTGKWQFIEVKRETLCLDEVLNFNWIS